MYDEIKIVIRIGFSSQILFCHNARAAERAWGGVGWVVQGVGCYE